MIKYVDSSTGFWLGVPMRDLTDEEWGNLPKVTRQALLDSGTFVLDIAPEEIESDDSEEVIDGSDS